MFQSVFSIMKIWFNYEFKDELLLWLNVTCKNKCKNFCERINKKSNYITIPKIPDNYQHAKMDHVVNFTEVDIEHDLLQILNKGLNFKLTEKEVNMEKNSIRVRICMPFLGTKIFEKGQNL